MERLYAKARDLDAAKSQFFANVSHDLRTPLIADHRADRAAAQRSRSSSTAHAQRPSRWWRAMRASCCTRSTTCSTPPGSRPARWGWTYVEADLSRIMRVVAGHFESLAGREGHRLPPRRWPMRFAVQLDADQIQRVLINLLSNAFKFTPLQRPHPLQPCASDASGSRVLVQVADSGRGIPVDQRNRVFERFQQIEDPTSPQQTTTGTGLGLAIARDIVHLHHGTIAVDEAAEGGARFHIDLPVRAPAGVVVHAAPAGEVVARSAIAQVVREIRAAPRATAETPTTLAGNLAVGPRILVVEDNPDLNAFIAEALRPMYTVRCAFTGTEGLAQALLYQPTVIVSDVMMPGMTGEELLHEVRRHPQLADTPMVLLTARSDDEFRIRVLRSGAQDFLAKPFSVEELCARVGNLVKARLDDERIRQLNTELVNGVARLESLSGQLQAANQELEAFSFAVSHDLHAPLRSITGFSQILAEDHLTQIDAKGQDLLNRIRKAGQRMQAMIDDLLRLSQVIRGELVRAPVDVSALAGEVIDDIRSRQPERRVEVVIRNGMAASADRGLLRAVFENLLGNAWKFTSKVAQPRIEVGWQQQSAGAGPPVYWVRDNGAGFSMAHAGKLFKAFARMHAQADFPGTGIGLATVSRIIARHHGAIRAESAVGEGTTFYFTLQPS
jgi:signal transduction histidine kinase